MGMLDELYKVSGLAKNKKKQQASQIGSSLSVLEEWIEKNLTSGELETAPSWVLLSLNQGAKAMLRITSKLEINYSEEQMDDLLLLAKHILLLKYLVAYDFGFRFNDKKKWVWPSLYALSIENENNLILMGEEAASAIAQLDTKYPY